jgi:hypothetical protein
MRGRIFLSSPPTGLDAYSQNAHELPDWVTPLLPPGIAPGILRLAPAIPRSHPPGDTLRCKRPLVGSGISTGCPSPTTFVLGLGPTNPERTSLAQETLGIRRVGFSPTFRYSCRHSHFRPLQPSSRSTFTADGTLPYHLPTASRRQIRSFGAKLEPR